MKLTYTIPRTSRKGDVVIGMASFTVLGQEAIWVEFHRIRVDLLVPVNHQRSDSNVRRSGNGITIWKWMTE